MSAAEAVAIGTTSTLHRGGSVTAEKVRITKSSPETTPGRVAMHEAAHIVVALLCGVGVKAANIVPNGPIEGTTHIDRMHKAALGAGGALEDPSGRGPASGDRMIAFAHGIDWGEAVSEARAVINGNMNLIRAIASALEKNSELGRSDIENVFDEAANGTEVILTFTDLNGSTETTTTRASPGTRKISIPNDLLLKMYDDGLRALEKTKKEKITALLERKKSLKIDPFTDRNFVGDQSRVD